MVIGNQEKNLLKRELVECLRLAPEVSKIIIFGSFLAAEAPNDIDIAIMQTSNQPYLALAMKYRRLARSVARRLPLDIIPLKAEAKGGAIMTAIAAGEVIFER